MKPCEKFIDDSTLKSQQQFGKCGRLPTKSYVFRLVVHRYCAECAKEIRSSKGGLQGSQLVRQ